MNTIRRCLLLAATTLAATGCHRDLPPGVSRQSLKALISIADEAVKQCDALLETPDCLHGQGWRGDPNRALVIDTSFFANVPEVRLLNGTCHSSPSDDIAINFYCEKIALDRGIDRSDECEKDVVDFGGWPSPKFYEEGIGVYTANAQCKTPESIVLVQRKTPKGRMLSVHGVFISKTWLDAHPNELKPKPLPNRNRRSPEEW